MNLTDLCAEAWSYIRQGGGDPDTTHADEAVGQAIGHLIDARMLLPAEPYDDEGPDHPFAPDPLLTPVEQAALRLTGALTKYMRVIIGEGPQAAADWREAAHEIHHVQHRILRQAAARAYPDDIRLLGRSFNGGS